jgi:DNA helicase-4
VHHPDSAENRRQVLQEELEHMYALGRQLDIACPSVQILRRTKKDSTTTEGLTTAYLHTLKSQYAGRLSIEFNSLHAAKGSEADFVILPGLDSGFRGFPDDRPAEPLLDLVLPPLGDNVEEERRLLYVGLTRARHAVSMLTATSRPSEFVLELDNLRIQHQTVEWIEHEQARIPCPRCHRGSLVKAPKSAFRICSKSNSCGYREKDQVRAAEKPSNMETVG